MSVPITVLGVTSLWPTTGDVGYSAQAEQLQKLLASAVDPISGLYNGAAPPITGGVGRLAMDNSGNLTFNGATVPTGGVVTSITVNGTAGHITSTGSPITSAGTITLDLATTAVTPGTYNYATLTVDAYGRLTSASSGTNPVTSVSGSSGRITSTGGTTPTLDLATTAVTAGSYTAANITVDAYGRITAASNGGGSGVGTVTSVGTAGTVSGLTLTGGPITTTGTVTLGGAITSATAMTGAIATPTYIDFATAATVTPAVGRLTWDATYGTLQLGLVGGNVNLQIGQELNQYVLNKTGSNLLNSQVVRISGAQGNRTTVVLAQADTLAHATGTIGMLTEDINNNQEGFVTTYGIVHDVNTGSFLDGDVLYLSATTPGGYTNVQPASPNQTVIIGYVVRAHATIGQIFIDVQPAMDLSDMSDVDITSPTTGQVLAYNGGYWANTTTTAALTMPSLTLSSSSTGITYNNDVNNHVPTAYQVVADTTNNVITARFRANGTPATGQTSRINLYSTGDTTNNSFLQLGINDTQASISTNKGGTGTAVPLTIGANNVIAMTIDTSGNTAFNGGKKIQGDFSSAVASRTLIQSSVTNGISFVSVVPNGTATESYLQVENAAAPANNALLGIQVTASAASLVGSVRGTGTALPLNIINNGNTAISISTSAVVSFANAITGFVTPSVQGPTSVSTSTTIDWTKKDVTKLTLTGNTAITNSGAVDGQKMILQLIQGGSGSYTVTFTSETKFGTSFTSITLSTAVGTMDMVGLVYSAVNSKYNIVSFAAGY